MKKPKIEAILRAGNNPFRSSGAYKSLMKFTPLRKSKEMLRRIVSAFFPYNYKLHGDPILRASFKAIGEQMNATSIVETGTYLGSTTSLLAKMFPNTPIFSGEINKTSYTKAKKNLRKFPNVKVYNLSSPDFLNHLIDKNLLGERPLFFLDAHWWKFWPLEDEIKIITDRLKSSVVYIDDFKIPGDDRFKFDRYEEKVCSVEMIKPRMNKKAKYNLLLPKYGREIFKDKNYHPDLVGYPIIFHNSPTLFKKFSSQEFARKFFIDKSSLLSKK